MQDKVRIGVAEDRFTGAIESWPPGAIGHLKLLAWKKLQRLLRR